MKALSQRWHWKGGKSQQRDWDLQKGALPMCPAWQTKLCCFKAKGETARDVAVMLEVCRWRVLGVSSV